MHFPTTVAPGKACVVTSSCALPRGEVPDALGVREPRPWGAGGVRMHEALTLHDALGLHGASLLGCGWGPSLNLQNIPYLE